jgi:hypothetical protein
MPACFFSMASSNILGRHYTYMAGLRFVIISAELITNPSRIKVMNTAVIEKYQDDFVDLNDAEKNT